MRYFFRVSSLSGAIYFFEKTMLLISKIATTFLNFCELRRPLTKHFFTSLPMFRYCVCAIRSHRKNNPVDTRRLFNVYKTSCKRWNDVVCLLGRKNFVKTAAVAEFYLIIIHVWKKNQRSSRSECSFLPEYPNILLGKHQSKRKKFLRT